MPGNRQSTIKGPLRTNEGVLMFPHLLAPETTGKFPSNKFITTFLIKQTEDVMALVNLCLAAAQAEWPTIGITAARQIRLPIRKGSEKPGWEDYLFLKAKSKNKPQVVDARKQPWTGSPKSGDICRLAVSAMPYKQQVDPEVAAALAAQGVLVQAGTDDNGRRISWRPATTFLLNGVQWLREGQAIGGGSVDGVGAFEAETPAAAGGATGDAGDLFG